MDMCIPRRAAFFLSLIPFQLISEQRYLYYCKPMTNLSKRGHVENARFCIKV